MVDAVSAGFSNGPWEADGLSVKVSGRGVIANIPTPQNGGVMECVSNARLIAAAPSLYADAEFLCARIRELEGEMRDDDDLSRQYFGHVLPAVARMESGLAEARGEQVPE